jgi:DNA-binding MarR family transcriptional regulator
MQGVALVEELERLFSSLARTSTTDVALTTTQRLALVELVDSGPLRLGALAERIGSNDATVSRAVDGLVEGGIVERQADPDDRRAVLHVSTVRGRSWVKRRRKEVAAALDEALARLTPADRERLLSLVRKLNSQLADSRHYPALLGGR